MSARERILTIRLLEKAAKHPLYAEALGIESAHWRIAPNDLQPPDMPSRAVVSKPQK